jgi:phosphoserine phosphatase
MIDHVATLISRPDKTADLVDAVMALQEIVPKARIAPLSPGEAMDLYLTEADAGVLRARFREVVGSLLVDVVVQPFATRRKKLLVADMDSTMIEQECLDELADFAGLKPQVAAITGRAMRGEIEFAPALRERVKLLAGMPLGTIERVIERLTMSEGGETLVATMRANGAFTLLVTGGFTAFAEAVADAMGFDDFQANRLLDANGRLTGLVAEPILGRDAKLAALEKTRDEFGLAPAETLAVGDGANDLDMIKAAGLGVAFHAKPKVAEAAAARIDHADLTALLFAQGYSREDFIG